MGIGVFLEWFDKMLVVILLEQYFYWEGVVLDLGDNQVDYWISRVY